MFRRFVASWLPVFLVVVAFSLNSFAQKTDQRSVLVESLLHSPDHNDMPWKVRFLDPRLMYQQMYLLQVRARVPAELLDAPGDPRVLHFLVKVQDSKGEWLPGDEYNRFEPAAKLGDTKDIECALAIYLRPGEYTVAMIAYESTQKRSNILRKKIVIPSLRGDPLPELDAHLPAAEFPDDFPQEELSSKRPSDGQLFPIGHQTSPIPIQSAQPIRIDLVINVSKQQEIKREPEMDPRLFRRRGFERPFPEKPSLSGQQQLILGSMLQGGSLISQLAPSNGCVFVSVVDPLRTKVVQDPKHATEINWQDFQKSIMKLDQNTIDARVLQNHKGPGMFTRDFLDKLSAESTCGDSHPATHYIVVLSSDLPLPEFNQEMRVSAATAERARFYFFHERSPVVSYDHMDGLLKPVKAVRMDFSNPAEFRKNFARFLADVRSIPSN